MTENWTKLESDSRYPRKYQFEELEQIVSNLQELDLIDYRGTVDNYAELAGLTELENGEAYVNAEDGLVYVWNGIEFPADGDGIDVSMKPVGEVEQGNELAVSGGEIYKSINPIEKTLIDITNRANYYDKSMPLVTDSGLNVGGSLPAGVVKIHGVTGWKRTGFIKLKKGFYTIKCGTSVFNLNPFWVGLFESQTDTEGIRITSPTFEVSNDESFIIITIQSPSGSINPDELQIVSGQDIPDDYTEYSDVDIKRSALPSDLKKEIFTSKKIDVSENRINPKDVVENSYIASDGSIGTSANFDVTGFIPIGVGETLYARTTTGAYSGLYDVDFNPIQGTFIQSSPNVVALTGTDQGVYARYSIRKTVFGRVTPNPTLIYTSYTEDIPRNEKYAIVNGGRPPYISHLGNYGQSNAVYKVENHTGRYRIKFEFKLDFNINSDLGDIPMIQFGDKETFDIKTAFPILQRESAEGNLGWHYQQCVGYDSGFKIGVQEMARNYPRKKPIVGLDAFSIWFKNVGGGTTWEDRMDWLELYQDMCISVDDDNLTFFRDGIGADGEEYNGGVTSVIATVPMKTAGVYKNLVTFYEDLQDVIDSTALLDGVLLDFENLAEDLYTDSLLQFEKVKMVAFANYQETPPSTTRVSQYDSFPLFFPLWKDNRTHTCEIVSSSERVWISIDGQTATTSLKSELKKPIYIGGSNTTAANILISNLEINRGSYGDAEVVNNIIISEMHPYVLGLCGHITYDEYYNESPGNQSLPRLLRVIDDLKNKGYYLASITDIVEWKLNSKTLPKRTAFIILDDFQIDNFWNTRHIRNALLKNGAKINTCLIEDRFTPENKERLTKSILNMRMIGWDSVIHAYLHDIRYAQKTSWQLEEEVNNCLEIADDTHQLSSVLVYSFGVLSTNMMKLIQHLGIQMAIDTRQIYSNGSTYEMGISREALQFRTVETIDTVLNYAL